MSEARLDDVIVRAPADVIYIGATFAADMKAYSSCVCMAVVLALRVAQLARVQSACKSVLCRWPGDFFPLSNTV